ncbi:CPBP family intramembrane glutamic endopeptidase [uncultured Lutibacter sp.]|uniref:CPBP family intramembrane glutamic endopeptidase n=1 Tax=uncultured Lutibacter sp. TaxID=437739 RepID=UPI002633E617|nr:CPBP family intramembrane glutamic endopeptidase [uncultured Lutibacter sp.]
MNILKAFLFTALLIAFQVAISLGFYEFIEPQVKNHISNENLIHYFGITSRVPLILSYTTIFLLFFRTNFEWNNGIDNLKKLNLRIIFYILILTVGLEFFDRPFFDFSNIIDYLNGIELEPFEYSESSNISLIYRGITALILAPIFEELLFRKLIFTRLLKKYSLNISIITSSICFALIHLPGYRNLLPTFIFGIISCLIYYKTKNIYYSIILHFLTNLSWMLFANYGGVFYEWIIGLKFNFIYWALFGIGTLMTYFGLKKITTANTV